MSAAQVVGLLQSKDATIQSMQQQMEALKHRLEWFERQVFGTKSERHASEPDPAQMHLGEEIVGSAPAPAERKAVAAHTRRVTPRDPTEEAADAVPFFDESRVPVQTITVSNPHVAGLTADQYEVIGEKISYRLAQRPGSYVVLKYVRQVIKRKDTQKLHCPPAPVSVIEGSRADVSLAAGLLVDKYAQCRYRHCANYAAAGTIRSLAEITAQNTDISRTGFGIACL